MADATPSTSGVSVPNTGTETPKVMRAAVCREYGPPDVVQVEDVPVPALGPDQVRVAITAGAVNFPDVLVVAGEYQIKVPPPFIVGSEFAGVVTEVGDGVTGLGVGDRVFGTAFV